MNDFVCPEVQTELDETDLLELSEAGITPRIRVRGELRKVFRLR